MQSFEEFADYIIKKSKCNNPEYNNGKVHIILDYPQLMWGDFYKNLMQLTWSTAYAIKSGEGNRQHVIFARTLDEACAQADNYDYAMISYVGTVYRSNHNNFFGDYFDKFIKHDNIPCRGHILWHPDRQYGRLHLQSMYLNLKHWREISRPTFGKYSGEVVVPGICPVNVHDDYTPLWLAPTNNLAYTSVKKAEMSHYISEVIKSGKTILNYEADIRSSKYFTYPQRPDISQQLINDREKSTNILYTRNNEEVSKSFGWKQLIKANKKFDMIYVPASGNIGEMLFDAIGHEDTKVVFTDYHEPTLKWKKTLFSMAADIDSIGRITNFIASKHDCRVDDCSYKPEIVERNLEVFSDQKWIDTIKKIKNVEFVLHDYLEDPVINVDTSKSNLFYLSNIFCYWPNYFHYNIKDISDKFEQYSSLKNTSIIGRDPFRNKVNTL